MTPVYFSNSDLWINSHPVNPKRQYIPAKADKN